jgi:hypothetical protein
MNIRTYATIALIGFTLCGHARDVREELKANPALAASNYLAYPTPEAKLTKAPKGYKPFYISHYGRHGSRWLIGKEEYKMPYEVLKAANDTNMLTAFGKSVFERVTTVYQASQKRLGELTPLGHRQHRGIADRMYHRFPEVFKGNTRVNAKSTVVIRCILSMTSETQRLAELNPDLQISTDASEAEMYYMNYWDGAADKYRKKGQKQLDQYYDEHILPARLMTALFTDSNYVKEKVNTRKLYTQLFSLMANEQSLDLDVDFSDVFTEQERYDMWQKRNAYWYLNFGPSPLADNRIPYTQRNLLKNILDTADTCVVSKSNNVTLRFGHEICVLPLACLLELNNCNEQIADFNQLGERWQSYRIFPMACNIQFIFYRTKNADDDILVKVLLNENEATLPIATDQAPYYKWKDVESYYRKKLADFKTKFED